MVDKAKGIVFIVIAVLVLSGCTSALEMNNTSGADSLLSTATYTQAPIITSTPTADPFAGLNVCHTWRDARDNCIVSIDDLLSGKLVDYARTVAEPFPADTFGLKLQPFNYTLGSTYRFVPAPLIGTTMDQATQDWLYSSNKWHANNAAFSDPRSPVGEKLIFWVKGDGTEYLRYDIPAAVIKIRNLDGSDGYYTIVHFSAGGGGAEDDQLNEQMFDDLFENMAYQPPYRDNSFASGAWVPFLEQNEKLIIELNEDETSRTLLDQWQDTGIIPKDLEKRPLLANSFTFPDWPWAK
jgi:hypothetical protein